MEISVLAIQQERKSNWSEAANLWRKIGRKSDADACQLIADSIAKGDAFRAEVDRVTGEEPELNSTNVRAWQEWHRKLSIIYNKHFRNAND